MESTIPFDIRVAVRVRYNGHIHHLVGFTDPKVTPTEIHLNELPKAYHDEHGVHGINYKFGVHCIASDPSGAHGWVCTEVVDLDATAGWE